MEIKFLGTGGAFDVELENSSAIVFRQGTGTLIDCGQSIMRFILRHDLVPQIDRIVVTHLHDDHVGSLSGLCIYYAKVSGKGKLKIVTPTPAFEAQLRAFLTHSLLEPEHYVEFIPMSGVPEIGYIDTFGKHVPGLQTYAYFFRNGSESIAYSGDLGDPDILFNALLEEKIPNPTVFHEIKLTTKVSAHVHYTELHPWLDRFKIYGYHCDPKDNPADNRIPLVANHPEFLMVPEVSEASR